MEKYLTRELAEHRQMGCEGPDSEGQRLRQLFEATVELVHSVYGDGAFRRWSGRGYKKQITPGLYDSIMQTVAQKVSEKDANWMRRVKAAKHELREDLKQLCQDQAFVAQLRAFSAKRLVARLDAYQRKVEAVLDKFGRTFPYADKLAAELYASQGQKCAICCHHMDDISHTQLDHIVPYSKGGASYPSNAQLVHRECNLAKGPKMEG